MPPDVYIPKTLLKEPIRVCHDGYKRFFDLVFSLFVLILGAPLFLLIALAIRLSSSGPTIYSHQRVGRGGRLFPCYKFRTMYRDADIRLKRLLEHDSTLRKEWEQNYKLKNDPRITPFGTFLRKTSLDELPQFWNALKGDMSIVGPRPVQQQEILRFGAAAPWILSVRPGLTGLWQTSGRSDLSYEARVSLDLQYIQERSFKKDLLLVAKTIPLMLSKRGAY